MTMIRSTSFKENKGKMDLVNIHMVMPGGAMFLLGKTRQTIRAAFARQSRCFNIIKYKTKSDRNPRKRQWV